MSSGVRPRGRLAISSDGSMHPSSLPLRLSSAIVRRLAWNRCSCKDRIVQPARTRICACSGQSTKKPCPSLWLPNDPSTSLAVKSTASAPTPLAVSTVWGDSAASTVTQLTSAWNPRRTWNGSNGLVSSRSAKHAVYLPNHPWVALSSSPVRAPMQFHSTSRTARPIAAFARLPGPNTFVPEFRPSSLRIGPLTTSTGPGPPVLLVAGCTSKSGCAIARMAARTTGRYVGRHPAMTALTTIAPACTAAPRTGS
ncbi:unannotated protein [freshwater metagenome]|uniref:Unannotated protein n=1 Tax=freshwater metagenome TaxID=449393 RepID=A0A6J7J599_9ZZZZ